MATSIDGWLNCGALPGAEQIAVMEHAGFVEVEIVARHDPFRGTSKEKTARKFGVEGISLIARKPR